MKISVVQIGNSRGIRIPKPLLKQTGIAGTVEVTVERDGLRLRAVRRHRAGWAAAARQMAASGADGDLFPRMTSANEFDKSVWKWAGLGEG